MLAAMLADGSWASSVEKTSSRRDSWDLAQFARDLQSAHRESETAEARLLRALCRRTVAASNLHAAASHVAELELAQSSDRRVQELLAECVGELHKARLRASRVAEVDRPLLERHEAAILARQTAWSAFVIALEQRAQEVLRTHVVVPVVPAGRSKGTADRPSRRVVVPCRSASGLAKLERTLLPHLRLDPAGPLELVGAATLWAPPSRVPRASAGADSEDATHLAPRMYVRRRGSPWSPDVLRDAASHLADLLTLPSASASPRAVVPVSESGLSVGAMVTAHAVEPLGMAAVLPTAAQAVLSESRRSQEEASSRSRSSTGSSWHLHSTKWSPSPANHEWWSLTLADLFVYVCLEERHVARRRVQMASGRDPGVGADDDPAVADALAMSSSLEDWYCASIAADLLSRSRSPRPFRVSDLLTAHCDPSSKSSSASASASFMAVTAPAVIRAAEGVHFAVCSVCHLLESRSFRRLAPSLDVETVRVPARFRESPELVETLYVRVRLEGTHDLEHEWMMPLSSMAEGLVIASALQVELPRAVAMSIPSPTCEPLDESESVLALVRHPSIVDAAGSSIGSKLDAEGEGLGLLDSGPLTDEDPTRGSSLDEPADSAGLRAAGYRPCAVVALLAEPLPRPEIGTQPRRVADLQGICAWRGCLCPCNTTARPSAAMAAPASSGARAIASAVWGQPLCAACSAVRDAVFGESLTSLVHPRAPSGMGAALGSGATSDAEARRQRAAGREVAELLRFLPRGTLPDERGPDGVSAEARADEQGCLPSAAPFGASWLLSELGASKLVATLESFFERTAGSIRSEAERLASVGGVPPRPSDSAPLSSQPAVDVARSKSLAALAAEELRLVHSILATEERVREVLEGYASRHLSPAAAVADIRTEFHRLDSERAALRSQAGRGRVPLIAGLQPVEAWDTAAVTATVRVAEARLELLFCERKLAILQTHARVS